MKKSYALISMLFALAACKKPCENTLEVNNMDQQTYTAFVLDYSYRFHLYSDPYGNQYRTVELPPNKKTIIDFGGNLPNGGMNIIFTLQSDTFSKDSYLRTCNQQTKTIDRF